MPKKMRVIAMGREPRGPAKIQTLKHEKSPTGTNIEVKRTPFPLYWGRKDATEAAIRNEDRRGEPGLSGSTKRGNLHRIITNLVHRT